MTWFVPFLCSMIYIIYVLVVHISMTRIKYKSVISHFSHNSFAMMLIVSQVSAWDFLWSLLLRFSTIVSLVSSPPSVGGERRIPKYAADM